MTQVGTDKVKGNINDTTTDTPTTWNTPIRCVDNGVTIVKGDPEMGAALDSPFSVPLRF